MIASLWSGHCDYTLAELNMQSISLNSETILVDLGAPQN